MLSLVLGIIVFGVAVVALIVGFRRGREGGGAVGVALVCYGLIFVIFTTLGRMQGGLWRSRRFATFDLFVWVGAYLALLDPVAGAIRELGARWRGTDRQGAIAVTRSTAAATVAMGVLSGLLVLEVLLGFTNGLTEGRNWHDTQSKVADVTANIKAAPDQLVRTFSPYIYSAEQVRRLAAFASADRLSLFATSLASTDRRSGLFAGVVTKVIRPSNGAVLSGKALLDATTASTANGTTVQFRVTGHGLHDALVATGQLSPYGWLASWDYHHRGRRFLPIAQRCLLRRRKDGREPVDHGGGRPPGPCLARRMSQDGGTGVGGLHAADLPLIDRNR